MPAEPMAGGWSSRTGDTPLPRHDEIPRHFQREVVPHDPACPPASDEPAYMDPDWTHAGAPVGTRYWQGFAKAAFPKRARAEHAESGEEERAMSPGWVARLTGSFRSAPLAGSDSEELDPQRDRVIRAKETDRVSVLRENLWPG